MGSILWRSSGRYLLRHPLLIGLSIIGVALGVAVVVGIDLANSSAGNAFRLSAEAVTGKATHQIVGSSNFLDESVYRDLRVTLGIRESAPVIEGYAKIPSDPGRRLQILGIDPFADSPFRSLTGGAGSDLDIAQFLGERATALIAEPTAQTLGLAPGDDLALVIDGIERRVEVVGLMAPDGELNAQAMENLMVVDVSTAQELFSLQGRLNRIDLQIPDTEQGAELLQFLEESLPAGVEVIRSTTRTETVEQMTRAFTLNLTALSLLALVVGMFLIYNTMTFSVVQRRSMVGRLRAIGVTKREVFRLILTEAVVIGIVGTVLGVLSGILLGRGLIQLVSQSINDLYYVVQVRSIELSAWTILKGVALGLGATVLATLAPAREATSAPASTVLRRSEDESRLQALLPRLVLFGLAFFLIAILLLIMPGRNIALSYVALLSVLVASALMTPSAVSIFATALRPILGRFGGIVGKMAARGIVNSLSRTSVAIASLTVAVAATVGVGVMVESFRSTVDVWLGYTLQADVYVSPPRLVSRRNDATITPRVAEIIRATPGITGSYSVRNTRVAVSDQRVDLVVIEPGPTTRETFQFKGDSAPDYWEIFDGGDVVMVSEPYSYRYGIKAGETIMIRTEMGERAFAVGAVYYDYGSDLGAIVMSRGTYDQYFNDSGISGIALYGAQGQDIDALVRGLQLSLDGEQDVFISSNRGLREASLAVFDRTFTITIVLRFLAVLVAFIGILSALMALQLERARELAIMRANGLTPRQVWRYVSMQTGAMGLMAGLFSIPLGLVLSYVLIFVINKRSFGWTLQIDIPPEILIQAVAVSIVAALLAGLYPAWKMAHKNAYAALREE